MDELRRQHLRTNQLLVWDTREVLAAICTAGKDDSRKGADHNTMEEDNNEMDEDHNMMDKYYNLRDEFYHMKDEYYNTGHVLRHDGRERKQNRQLRGKDWRTGAMVLALAVHLCRG